MKKFAKAMVVGGITLGTVLGFNVTEHNGVSNEAHAQTQTSQGYHYHYQGYTKSGGEFVLNHTFYNALKAGNVTFNGIKVNDQYQNGTSTKNMLRMATWIMLLCHNRRYKRAAPHREVLFFVLIKYIDECHNES